MIILKEFKQYVKEKTYQSTLFQTTLMVLLKNMVRSGNESEFGKKSHNMCISALKNLKTF